MTCGKIGFWKRKFCSLDCYWKSIKGKRINPTTEFKKGKKHSKNWYRSMKNHTPWNKGKPFLQIRGENHPHWKGGITPLYRSIRNLPEMKDWSIDCMKRDNFTCQECGRKRCPGDRVVLDVHHIISFKDIVKNIKTLDEARNCKKLWDRQNGKTLCRECHNKTKGSNQYKV